MVSDGCAPTGDARGRTTRASPVAPVLLAAASSRMARFRLNAALEAHRKSPWICARPRSLILRNPAIGSTQPKTRSTRGPTGLTQRVALVQRGAEINRTAAHPVRVLTHVRRRTQGAHGGDDARRVVRPVVPDATPPPYAVRQQEPGAVARSAVPVTWVARVWTTSPCRFSISTWPGYASHASTPSDLRCNRASGPVFDA